MFGSDTFNHLPVIWSNGSFHGYLERKLKRSTQLPSKDDIQTALDKSNYDSYPWDNSVDSFRNELEGNKDSRGKITSISDSQDKTLFSQVISSIGGTIGTLETAANDPIFWLHLSMIDRIFEKWLHQNSDAEYSPIGFARPGHNRYDCLFGILPVKSNNDMFQKSSGLGFKYDNLTVTPKNKDELIGLVALPVIVGVLATLALIRHYRQSKGYAVLSL